MPAADPTPSPLPRCPRAVETSRPGEASAAPRLRDGRTARLASPRLPRQVQRSGQRQAQPRREGEGGAAPALSLPGGAATSPPRPACWERGGRVTCAAPPPPPSLPSPPLPRACKPGRELPPERSSPHAPRTGTISAAPGGTPRPAASPAGGRRVAPATCAPHRSSVSDRKNLFHQRSAPQSAAQGRGGRRAGSRS